MPTERSVATGVAAAGLPEAEPPHRRALPGRPLPYESPTTRMPTPEARARGSGHSPLGAVAIVLCALVVAGGLVAGALVLAEGRESDEGTVVRTTHESASASAGSTAEAEPAEEAVPAEEPAEEVETGSSGERFFGNYYYVTIPAGWFQEEEEAWASDGSYIENTWLSPTEDEALKIDESPGEPGDPAVSASGIAADLENAGNAVYSLKHGVLRGGLIGSEIAFRSTSGLPERVDFFFTLGDNGFAVMASTYDIDTSRRLVNAAVASLELME